LGYHPGRQWLKPVLLAIHAQQPLLLPSEVSVLMLSLARLHCNPSDAYLARLVGPLVNHFDQLPDLVLLQLTWAAATLRWQAPQPWLTSLVNALAVRLPGLTEQGLGMAHGAVLALKLGPVPQWRQASLAAGLTRVNAMSARCLTVALNSWAQQQALEQLTPLSAAAAAPVTGQPGHRTAAAAAAAAGSGAAALLRRLSSNSSSSRSSRSRSSGLASITATTTTSSSSTNSSSSCCSEESAPPHSRAAVAEVVLPRVLQLLGSCTPTEQVWMLVGVARLRLAPPQAWLRQVVLTGALTKSMLTGLPLTELCWMVWAAAKLGFRAPLKWVKQVEGRLEVARWESRKQLYRTQWALTVLRQLAA
jgi:hypothetical protein